MGEESSVTLLPPPEVTSVLRIQGPEDEFPRFIDDHDGDVEVRVDDGGRFSVVRLMETTREGLRLYKLIGNYGPAWSIEDTKLVRYTEEA